MPQQKDISAELQALSPAVAGINSVNPYTAPEGYFENLAGDILVRIRIGETTSPSVELELISPFLKELDKNIPYTVPAGYFENLSPELLRNNIGTRVIKGSFGKKLWKIAAAAVIAGMLATGAWLFTDRTIPGQNQLAYTQDSAAQNQILKQVQNMSETEMADFMESTLFNSNYDNAAATTEIKDEDIKLLLADISEQELETFLQQDDSLKEKFN